MVGMRANVLTLHEVILIFLFTYNMHLILIDLDARPLKFLVAISQHPNLYNVTIFNNIVEVTKCYYRYNYPHKV